MPNSMGSKMAELYRLDFPSGKSYIGITKHTALMRFDSHGRCAAKSSKGIVYHAWRKYGAPKLVTLAVLTEDDMLEAEKRAIVVFGTRHPNGYNMTDGGDIPPSLSPEVANKIRMKLKGRKLSDERRLALSRAVTGRKHTEEAKLNMSRAQKGKIISAIGRARMAAAKLGTTAPPEKKAKMSASQKARRKREGCIQK